MRTKHILIALRHAAGCVFTLLLASACASLAPVQPNTPTRYVLGPSGAGAPLRADVTHGDLKSRPLLVVNPPHAAAGFDSQHIMYVQAPSQLAHYANSEWIDTPARMLGPLLTASLADTNAFAGVLSAPSVVRGDLSLETTLIRLQQELVSQPNVVRMTLQFTLIDNQTQRVLATQTIERSAPATQDNAAGGVEASNRVLRAMLEDVQQFCIKSADSWQRAQPRPDVKLPQ